MMKLLLVYFLFAICAALAALAGPEPFNTVLYRAALPELPMFLICSVLTMLLASPFLIRWTMPRKHCKL